MKWSTGFLLLVLLSPAYPRASAQGKAAPSAARSLPPFSGTWVLNLKRSEIAGPRPNGVSSAVIAYDGKTWHYIHSHLEAGEEKPDQWQVTLAVGSPKYHVEKMEPLTFRSRLARQGDALVLSEIVTTDRGERTITTVRYTLEDAGNTLVQLERQKGPLGVQTNRYVLEREGAAGAGSAEPAADPAPRPAASPVP